MTRPAVVTVLRSGGVYDARWAFALKRNLHRYADARFYCLTDTPDAVRPWGVPLAHDWPGWWSKLEIFRPDLADVFGDRVWFLDLDTLIVDAPDLLTNYAGDFGMMTGFYRDILQSAVMSFRPASEPARAVWDAWIADPEAHMAKWRGDGEWLNDHVSADRLMDRYPGQIASLKIHARREPPPGARLVLAHGTPKFTDPDCPDWARREWEKWAA